MRKFICVIPRVHGGYFDSSSRVIHRVHQGETATVLVGGRILQDIGLVAEVVRRRRKAEAGTGVCARVILQLGLLRSTLGCCLTWNVFLGEATLKTALALLEWPLDVICHRKRDAMKRASNSSGDAPAAAVSARAGGEGHSIDCIGSPRTAL